MQIPRIYDNLDKFIKPNKVVVIYGPRQVGKTTLLNNYLKHTTYKYRLDSGENIRVAEILSSQDFSKLREYAGNYELLVIDEAQKIPNVGMGLKILVDSVSDIRIIVTGSSSFELAGQVGEPLTGRKYTLNLYPIAQVEYGKMLNSQFDLKEKLSEFLIFGSYPAVLTADIKSEKIRVLQELADSYLVKDILALDKIKKSKIILDLLRLLAFQIGSEVSLSELGQKLALDYKTVSRYLDLLEKAFVIFRLRGFSRNLRNEVNKKNKYYFYDTGIRNAVISNFNDLSMRDDIGGLWENFLVAERLKNQAYSPIYANNYFWRTWQQKEIDWVEERDGRLYGFEFKWGARKYRPPQEFLSAYPEGSVEIINKENYLQFVGCEK